MDRRDVWAVSKPVPCIISMVIISFMDRSVESELCIAILTATLGEENSHLFERTNVPPKRVRRLVRKYIIMIYYVTGCIIILWGMLIAMNIQF